MLLFKNFVEKSLYNYFFEVEIHKTLVYKFRIGKVTSMFLLKIVGDISVYYLLEVVSHLSPSQKIWCSLSFPFVLWQMIFSPMLRVSTSVRGSYHLRSKTNSNG